MKSVSQPIIIADSISPNGIRLTTWQLQYWRAIHSELMTHRVFSRNAGSSRARPSMTIIDSVSRHPWGPTHWGKNQAGMQAGEETMQPVRIPTHLVSAFKVFAETVLRYEVELKEPMILVAEREHAWHFCAWLSGKMAEEFHKADYHKQIVNRITEPYNYIDVLVTATDFNNWYALRDHKDAEPHIRDLAAMMKEEISKREPIFLTHGKWHLPYIKEEDRSAAIEYLEKNADPLDHVTEFEVIELLKRASAARCARVSYKLFDNNNANFDADLKLFQQLMVNQPLHASPAEHQATPDGQYNNMGGGDEQWKNRHEHGNFRGWRQHRKQLANEFIPG